MSADELANSGEQTDASQHSGATKESETPSDDQVKCALWKLFEHSARPEIYLALRKAFPDVTDPPRPIAWLDELFSLAEELEREGISATMLAGVLDADEVCLDQVSLQILQALVKLRDQSGKQSHVQSRGLAVKLSLIDYLIAIMSECMASHDIAPPFSFFVVIWERFKIYGSSRHKRFLEKERRTNTALLLAQLYPSDPVPIREAARQLHLDAGTLSRWLSDEQFRARLRMFRQVHKDHPNLDAPGLHTLRRM
jgi:hypothetical protein